MPAATPPVLVIAPHPDDESLGCGGTIRLLAQTGTAVDVVFMTRGERGAEAPGLLSSEAQQRLAETRTAEAQEACRILGVRQVQFLSGADTRLAEQPHVGDELRRCLTAEAYGRVFCPGPRDQHPDHAATIAYLRRAVCSSNAAFSIWFYEVWTPLQPNLCVSIDITMDAKLAAIQAHKSQLSYLDYLTAFRGLAAYRSLFSPTSRYAEAFFTCDAELLRTARWEQLQTGLLHPFKP